MLQYIKLYLLVCILEAPIAFIEREKRELPNQVGRWVTMPIQQEDYYFLSSLMGNYEERALLYQSVVKTDRQQMWVATREILPNMRIKIADALDKMPNRIEVESALLFLSSASKIVDVYGDEKGLLEHFRGVYKRALEVEEKRRSHWFLDRGQMNYPLWDTRIMIVDYLEKKEEQGPIVARAVERYKGPLEEVLAKADFMLMVVKQGVLGISPLDTDGIRRRGERFLRETRRDLERSGKKFSEEALEALGRIDPKRAQEIRREMQERENATQEVRKVLDSLTSALDGEKI